MKLPASNHWDYGCVDSDCMDSLLQKIKQNMKEDIYKSHLSLEHKNLMLSTAKNNHGLQNFIWEHLEQRTAAQPRLLLIPTFHISISSPTGIPGWQLYFLTGSLHSSSMQHAFFHHVLKCHSGWSLVQSFTYGYALIL